MKNNSLSSVAQFPAHSAGVFSFVLSIDRSLHVQQKHEEPEEDRRSIVGPTFPSPCPRPSVASISPSPSDSHDLSLSRSPVAFDHLLSLSQSSIIRPSLCSASSGDLLPASLSVATHLISGAGIGAQLFAIPASIANHLLVVLPLHRCRRAIPAAHSLPALSVSLSPPSPSNSPQP